MDSVLWFHTNLFSKTGNEMNANNFNRTLSGFWADPCWFVGQWAWSLVQDSWLRVFGGVMLVGYFEACVTQVSKVRWCGIPSISKSPLWTTIPVIDWRQSPAQWPDVSSFHTDADKSCPTTSEQQTASVSSNTRVQSVLLSQPHQINGQI